MFQNTDYTLIIYSNIEVLHITINANIFITKNHSKTTMVHL